VTQAPPRPQSTVAGAADAEAPDGSRRRRRPAGGAARATTYRERVTGATAWGVVAFLAPFLVLYLGFTVWPLAATVYYSLFDWNGAGPPSKFVGGANYSAIAADGRFWKAVVNTLIFAVGNTVIKLPLALLFAIVLTRRWMWGKRLLRTVFFVPIIIPVALAGIIFTFLLNPSNGALNALLRDLGVIDEPYDVFANRWTAMTALILVSVWQIFGQYMIYWMAALQNVPDDLYEAADLDGANEWQKLTRVTLPVIKPTAVVITLLALINAMHVFGLVVTLTDGGPGDSTNVVSLFIYREAFNNPVGLRYGYASAAALLFAVLAAVFVGAYGVLGRRAERVRREYLS
jgi:ABC-type sugar transport system permease subunit